MSNRRVEVFGPAYLDRVLRVDRPLFEPSLGPPFDQSSDGEWKFTSTGRIVVVDASGYTLEIELPNDWPGPAGEVRLPGLLREGAQGRRRLCGLDWHDDLGGMGAGYAAALHGSLVCALGAEADPTGKAVSRRLTEHHIAHTAIRIADHPADWTLLISSGEFGDKLPIGFRGCHLAVDPVALVASALPSCTLRVVASLPNEISAHALRVPGAGVRLFAPSMRNVLDRDFPISRFAAAIDVLCCNRIEWESLEDREEVRWQLSILVVTDGPRGSTVHYTNPGGDPGLLRVEAFPRYAAPRDTNRAGEAYGAAFIASLLDQGWNAGSGVVEDDLIRVAGRRASAAAALVLDRVEFGFPAARQVDEALVAGHV
jgi:sugar/nucleoside kinase (ribokinase family)